MLGTITLTVGQTDAMPQKEDSPESVEVLQDEVAPQVNGEKEENECISADETTPTEEKVAEEKPTESNEVGFKKIFRFVGFKFTLKKDKNEKTEPVQLLTVKETEDGASEAAAEETKQEPVTAEIQSEDEKEKESPEMEKEASAEDAAKTEAQSDLPATDAPAETKLDGAEETEKTPADEPAEEAETSTEKEKELEPQAESPTSPPSQETQSPLRRFFTQGIFSNLRKKTSFKKSKEEEPIKEKSVEEDIKEAEEKEEEAAGAEGQVKEDAEEVEAGEKVDKSEAPEKSEASPEEAPSAPEEQKEEELKVEVETTSETAPVQEPAPVEQITTCEDLEASAAEEKDETKPTDDTKLTDDKATDSSEEQQTPEKSPAETSTEAEIQSSQDKTKAQGSPLKKLFTGAGLKKLSSKKQKAKKETESKPTESTEQAAEQIQSSTESGEAQKPDSGASSPEESGEHVVGEASQADPNVEAEGEATTSDSEKKKDGILHWASFKKLVTPKKRVKKSSESEDEAPGDKPKSATLSSTESAVFEEKTEEVKSSDEVKEEAKEETQVECKTETKAEKFEQSTEEPKKKLDTSVSWEALICVGSAKKRARKTSDSDDEETKIEEEVQQSGEEQAKTAESPLESSQDVERENLASSPEPEGELVSTWESFKRLVTHRKKPKAEDKSDEAQSPEQAASDSELPKEESSFSLRKLIPRRKKKSDAKQGQVSSDIGSAEEDSDTPAVVPLSEYDNEQTEKATDEQDTETKTEDAKPEVTPVTPGKASAEDRSPSWISTTVENVEDEAEGKPLSDIPEEGDTAATPKSTDNTIVEDIIEFTSEAITAVEPAEETEMISALSRITESPVTSGETSPVPDDGVVKKAESILQEAVETTSITPSAVAVTVTEEQTKSIAVTSSPFQIESAIKEEKVVLAVHEKSEAVAICTGLDASEIKAIEEESPLKATVEAVTTVNEALSVEVAAEDQTLKPEEAQETGEKVFAAQINEVQTECKEQPKASVETTVEETLEVPTTDEIQEATAVKVEVVTIVQQEMEILEEQVVAENTPKVVAESPVESTIEQPVCAQIGEITEVSVAKEEVQELKDVEESVATAEAESVEVAVAVSEEVTTSLADTIVVETTTMSEEDLVPVLAATEEHAVTREIVCVCAPSESKTEAEVMETVLPTEVHVATNVEVVSVSVSVEENGEVASSNVSTVTEEACKKDEERVEAMHLKEAEAIQEQSTVIVQEVLQNIVENMGQELKEKPVEEIDTATPEEVPSAAEEDKSAQDAPVTEEKSTVDTQIQEETKPETEDKAEEQLAQISTVRSPVTEAIQISETVLVAMTEEIKAQEEDVSSVSAEATQLCTDVKKQEVELKEDEKKLEEDRTVTTESEDGKCQVEKNQNEEPSGTTETPASEESSQMQTVTLVSTKYAQIVEEVQDTKIETTTKIDVGIIHVVDAAERATQDTEIAVKEDSTKSQEPSKDVPQTDLEEAQKDISTPDMKGKESSGDPDCQKTDAEASEVKTAAEETPKATKEEDMEKKIDTITTETATES